MLEPLPRHVELVSASMPHRLCENGISQTGSGIEAWTLKQVQGDEVGETTLSVFAPSRETNFLFTSREGAKARRFGDTTT